jgi:hypothetical protein
MFTKQMEKAHGKVAFLAWDNETEDGQDGEGDQ